MELGYSSTSAMNLAGDTFNVLSEPSLHLSAKDTFKERSVAVSRMTLQINAGQFDISKIEDIEIIIQHQSYARPQIVCP